MKPSPTDLLPPARHGVLVADDEPMVRTLVEEVLGRSGFAVRSAANGQEAVNLFHQYADSIHFALLDVQMPFLDGPHTLLALHAIRPDLPCCFMSGNTGSYSEQDLLDLGAIHLLLKPFDLAEVARLARQFVERPQRRREARASVPSTRVAFDGQHGWLRDRSPGGLGLWSPKPVPVGSVFNLRSDDAAGAIQPGRIEVRRCQPDTNGWTVGCRREG
jgi:CheY-like chemotaxis protein